MDAQTLVLDRYPDADAVEEPPIFRHGDFAPVDKGYIDWAGQFRAFKQMGYRDAVSLETHWHGGGTPEESSRQSWAGMQKELRAAGDL